MNDSHNSPNSLKEAIQKYREALEEIFGEQAVQKVLQETEKCVQDEKLPGKTPDLWRVLKLLHARDAVQDKLEEKPSFEELSSYSLALIHLDQFLKDQANIIAQNESLLKACKSLKPPESHWWWFLEAKQFDPWWSRADWLWNVFTVIVLAFASSNIIITAKAFSKGGFDWFGAFTTVIQSGVVVAFAGGALTDKGNKLAEDVLTHLNIPKNLHAESTFVMSASFCALTYLGNQQLPLVGAYYYRQGMIYEKNLKWESAKNQYERALNFLPDDPNIYVALGNTYEFLSDLPNAQDFYKKAFDQGDSASAIRYAKILVLQTFDETMWNKAPQTENPDKTYEQEETKYKFKEKIERDTMLQNAARALEVAEVRIRENIQARKSSKGNKGSSSAQTSQNSKKENPSSQNSKKENSFDNTREMGLERLISSDMKRQIREINLVKGLLNLMQVNFEDSEKSKDTVIRHLSEASFYFNKNTNVSVSLDLDRLSQCYLTLTKLAQNKIKNFNSESSKSFAEAIKYTFIDPIDSDNQDQVIEVLMLLANLTNNESLIPEEERKKDLKYLQSKYSSALANYLLLTEDEVKEKNVKKLEDRLFDKLYLLQFEDVPTAQDCYAQLAKNSQISPREGSIMNTILETKW